MHGVQNAKGQTRIPKNDEAIGGKVGWDTGESISALFLPSLAIFVFPSFPSYLSSATL